jgi:hypothetical protein
MFAHLYVSVWITRQLIVANFKSVNHVAVCRKILKLFCYNNTDCTHSCSFICYCLGIFSAENVGGVKCGPCLKSLRTLTFYMRIFQQTSYEVA